MLPALKLSLDGFQLRDHPLVRRDPPDDECSITAITLHLNPGQALLYFQGFSGI
jgi:hypothetical protein